MYENIVMDYIPFTLKDVIVHNKKNNKKLSMMKLWQISGQVANAVAHMHECRMLHRDIKPENILVDNSTFEVALTDLGCSKILKGASLERRNPNCVTLW
mmetsp:Transcript_16128/g.35416  ORF Transcript_16128/g.35416 Transcript_16128/m.35416 type:complete len:99 (-) Transcript_16128:804-1100(-)